MLLMPFNGKQSAFGDIFSNRNSSDKMNEYEIIISDRYGVSACI